MKRADPMLLRLYWAALALYPALFRHSYREQMWLVARDATSETPGFWWQLGRDLLVSLSCEHWFILRRQMMKQPLIFHTIGLILILTLLGGAAAVTAQQMLRRGADQPQTQMVEHYAARIVAGTPLTDVIPSGHVDMAESLEPFLIFYDERGQPSRGNGFLDSGSPVPPLGVFEFVRAHGFEKVTWQPRPGVRIAAVARRIDGARPGFLLAGRSLRVVEEYENALYRLAILGWVLVVGLLTAGAALLQYSASRTLGRVPGESL